MTAQATAQGTARHAARHSALAEGHFRSVGDLAVSSIGLGTYLGGYDQVTDALYAEAVAVAVRRGVNLLDTAINYRCMRSERSIGAALRALSAEGIGRDEVVVCTKGGFVPFDGAPPRDAARYFRETYVETGLARPEELVAGCHCLAPRYLSSQIDKSLENLGLDSVDVYYLHNPETQLGEVSRTEFRRRLRAAFELCEERVSRGQVRWYGTATWQAYRVPAGAPEHLSLAELAGLAEEVAGPGHHFRVVQLPYNLAMGEAYSLRNQEMGGTSASLLDTARALGIAVIASAPLYQARLTGGLPAKLRSALGLDSDAQRAIQFVRSTPGITAALVGMKRRTHVEENLAVARVPPLSRAEFALLFGE